MPRYVKLAHGNIMVVYSDNTEENTMHGYPVDQSFDPEVDVLTQWHYQDVIEESVYLYKLTDVTCL